MGEMRFELSRIYSFTARRIVSWCFFVLFFILLLPTTRAAGHTLAAADSIDVFTPFARPSRP